MRLHHKHIVLIGFKHSGKSIIGKHLAKKLEMPFVDLDKSIEQLYEKKFKHHLNCRMIMQQKGTDFFRRIETEALMQTLAKRSSIISLGGGTPLSIENQQLIKPFCLIHIMAPKGIIFERIVINGRPAFINPEDNLFEAFNRLWDERISVYEQIQDFSILNDSSVHDSINKITHVLNVQG